MKLLGIDYGEAKIGLAISNGEIAEPYEVIKIANKQSFSSNSEWRIKNICQQEKIEKIIIGLSEGEMAEKTREFGEEIKKITGLPVEYQDETLTSQKAVEKMNQSGKARMKKKSSEHSISAALILQEWLDDHK